ncbi:MAG: thioredoxin fold domain-containing protein [Crocinitomicaceae bacterium]
MKYSGIGIILLVFVQFIFWSSSQEINSSKPQGPQDFEELLIKAQMQKSLIVLYATANQCYSCEKIFSELEGDPKLDRFLKANFLSYEVNIQESPSASYLVERYKLHEVPAIIFMDEHGHVIAKLLGIHKTGEIHRFAKKILKKHSKE